MPFTGLVPLPRGCFVYIAVARPGDTVEWAEREERNGRCSASLEPGGYVFTAVVYTVFFHSKANTAQRQGRRLSGHGYCWVWPLVVGLDCVTSAASTF